MHSREFVVHFQTTVASIDGLKALRATLKFALKRFGLRTVDACEVLSAAQSRHLAVESLVDAATRSASAPTGIIHPGNEKGGPPKVAPFDSIHTPGQGNGDLAFPPLDPLQAPLRRRLPWRRGAETITVVHWNQPFVVTVGFYDDGALGEIFIDSGKTGGDAAAIARDAGVVISLALQHGAAIETIQHAITRNSNGTPSSILGAVIDALSGTAIRTTTHIKENDHE